MYRWLIAAAFLSTVPAANWLIGNVGTSCVPHGPCLVPVLPGVMAPSGVLVIGVALVLRSTLQEVADRRWVLACVVAGSAVSATFAPPSLVLASTAAFLAGELADWAVFSRLRAAGLPIALLAAGLVGSVIDSSVFLGLAFGSLDFLLGQVVGKMWASLIASAVIPRVLVFARAPSSD